LHTKGQTCREVGAQSRESLQPEFSNCWLSSLKRLSGCRRWSGSYSFTLVVSRTIDEAWCLHYTAPQNTRTLLGLEAGRTALAACP